MKDTYVVGEEGYLHISAGLACPEAVHAYIVWHRGTIAFRFSASASVAGSVLLPFLGLGRRSICVIAGKHML